MRILLVTHFYPPEIGAPQRRWSALVKRFVEAGHEVVVVTGLPHYPTPRLLPGARKRVFVPERGPSNEWVIRVPFLPNSRSPRGKLADQLVVAGLSTIAGLVQRIDLVLATVPGMPTAFGGELVGAVRGKPLVVEMRDAWPDLLFESGVASGRAGR